MKQVFNKLEIGPLLLVILPTAADQITKPLICGLGDHRPHLVAQLPLDSSKVHLVEWDLTSLQLVEDHAIRVDIDSWLVMEALSLIIRQ